MCDTEQVNTAVLYASHILEVSSSNPGNETDYPDRGISSSCRDTEDKVGNDQYRFHSNPSLFIITSQPSVGTALEARCRCTARYCERSSCKLSLHFALFGLVS